MTHASRHLSVGEGSLLQMFVPLGIAPGGVVFFAEHLTALELPGGALILLDTAASSSPPPACRKFSIRVDARRVASFFKIHVVPPRSDFLSRLLRRFAFSDDFGPVSLARRPELGTGKHVLAGVRRACRVSLALGSALLADCHARNLYRPTDRLPLLGFEYHQRLGQHLGGRAHHLGAHALEPFLTALAQRPGRVGFSGGRLVRPAHQFRPRCRHTHYEGLDSRVGLRLSRGGVECRQRHRPHSFGTGPAFARRLRVAPVARLRRIVPVAGRRPRLRLAGLRRRL
jgi:hypothetical protein